MDKCLDEYITTARTCLKLLRDLVNDINAHHGRCKVVKTVGTTASITGGAFTVGCIVGAFFTGGATLVALAGAGAVVGTAGAVTNVGTDVVDMIWTKKYIDELKEIDDRLQCVARRFARYVEQVGAEAARIYEQNGGNEEEALKEALMTIGKIGWNGYKVVNIASNIGGNVSSTLLRNGGKAWQGMRTTSPYLVSAFKKIGLDVSKRAAFNIMRAGTAALSAIFIVLDIQSLADTLESNHPAVEPVEKQIDNINDILNNLTDLRDSLN